MEVIYLKGHEVCIQEPVCCAIGFFDGLHLGHMELVEEVDRIAKQKGYKKGLMTFDHYPLFVLKKVKEEHYLTTIEDRQKILSQYHFDYLFVIQFTKETASLSPEQFIEQYMKACHIKHIVCGFDFHFGKANQGGIETLKNTPCLDVSVVEEVMYDHEKISSTRIRHLLQKGEVDKICYLLGRYYSLHGVVIKGRQIGRTIGFPTANIDYQGYLLPKNGVYAVKIYRNKNIYLGMCNIGYNPTFEALDKKSLEVYIFDFCDDIYGEDIAVEFYCMIRDEKPFENQQKLIEQLCHDQLFIKSYFNNFISKT